MATIPKLRLNNKANENVRVAELQSAGKAEAQAILQTGKAVASTIQSVGTIVDLKQQQESRTKSMENQIQMQQIASDDAPIKERFRREFGEDATVGYAKFKSEYLQTERDRLADQISHPKVRGSFLENSSIGIRKSFSYDLSAENREIFQKVKQEKDRQLVRDTNDVRTLDVGPNGDREFSVTLTKGIEDINKSVEDGMITPEKATLLKDEYVNRMNTTRLMDMTEKGSFDKAERMVEKMDFSNPKARDAAIRNIEATESRRLREKRAKEREAELAQKKREQALVEEYFDSAYTIVEDESLDIITKQEKMDEITKLYKDQGVKPKFVRAVGKLTDQEANAYLQDVKYAYNNPEMSISDKNNQITALTEVAMQLPAKSELRVDIQKAVNSLRRNYSAVEKRFIKDRVKKLKETNSSFRVKIPEEFNNMLAKYQDLPVDEQYSKAEKEYNLQDRLDTLKRKELNASKAEDLYEGQAKYLNDIEDAVKLVGNPEAQDRIIKAMSTGWFKMSREEAEKVVQDRVAKAEEYLETQKELNEFLGNTAQEMKVIAND